MHLLRAWADYTAALFARGADHRAREPGPPLHRQGVGNSALRQIEQALDVTLARRGHRITIRGRGAKLALAALENFYNRARDPLSVDDIQLALVRSMKGLENCHILRPGYAIEYDYFDPTGLHASLETKLIKGLFFAGQINGTTGYEEAAAQGLLAGANAALQVQGKDAWSPRRDEAYIGVLVDDLITRGVSEPYRMFTSRAEYRLSLREDNADMRLTEQGRRLGLVGDARWAAFCEKQEAIAREQQRLRSTWVHPDKVDMNAVTQVLGKPIDHEYTLYDLLRRPDVNYGSLMSLVIAGEAVDGGAIDPLVIEQVEIQAKYQGYIDRQSEEVAKSLAAEETKLPEDIDYTRIGGLSNEIQQKLIRHRPETIGQASRIQGMTPAAISILLVHLKRGALAAARSNA